MSVSTTTVITHSSEAVRAKDVRAALCRLSFRRRLWQSGARIVLALSFVLMFLCVLSLIDYTWAIRRVWRIGYVSPIWFACLFVFFQTIWTLLRKRTLIEAAQELERAAGSHRNTLTTFAEHFSPPQTTPTDNNFIESNVFNQSYIFNRLQRQAESELDAMRPIIAAPRRNFQRHAIALLFVALFLLLLRFIAPLAFARETKRVVRLAPDDAATAAFSLFDKSMTGASTNNPNDPNAPVSIEGLQVRVLPPAYSGLGVEDVSNSDAPVRALAGSQIEVSLHAQGTVDKAVLGFAGTTNQMRALEANRFVGTFNARSSGAFEVRVATPDESSAPASIVRAVEVYADAAPEARITEPAGDQLLRRAPDRAVIVSWTARDDLGLQNVVLRFIKSRGEGDAAKFTSGEAAPTQTEHTTAREWRGQFSLDVVRQDMQAGDTLVFWVEARDRNPFANNTGRSASLSIAVKGAEVFKLDLSDLRPSEVGRFLLSERLILMHTEKLHNERTRLAQNELTRRANTIAAEQREFKNSFNDYINIEGAGEEQAQAIADERTEIHNHGIPEPPPGAPTSVTEMTRAINAMWDAEDALSASDTAKALVFEREALARLKLAQAAVRYVPPVLPRSKPLDLKRRYAGELTEIKTKLEKLARRPAPKESAPVRAALADAYNALSDLQSTFGLPAVGRASAIARAHDKAQAAANRLVSLGGGDHSAIIAEAAGQMRIVETELQRLDTGGVSEDFAARLAKPLALLAQAASNLYAIAEQSTRGSGNDGGSGAGNALTPSDDARADEYFRRLTHRASP